MNVGDKLLFIGNKNDINYTNFTNGRQYEIFKIDNYNIHFEDERCCWIIDDFCDQIYFRESEAVDDNFKCIKHDRKSKLKKNKFHMEVEELAYDLYVADVIFNNVNIYTKEYFYREIMNNKLRLYYYNKALKLIRKEKLEKLNIK